MNAYKLADELDWLKDDYKYVAESANLLRQQADRIAELEKVIQLNDEVLKPMLIDCIKRNLNALNANLFFAKYDSVRGTKERITPQTKPLSDEEIKQIWYDLYPLSSSSYWDDKREGIAELKFARAIEERHGIK